MSQSFLMLHLVVALTCVALTFSFDDRGKCKACGGNPPYDASCDTPTEVECKTDPLLEKKDPYSCITDFEADSNGNSTGKLKRSICFVAAEPSCHFVGGDVPVYHCYCNETLCDGPPQDIFNEAVKIGMKLVEEEKKKKGKNSAPPLWLGSTSIMWTGLAFVVMEMWLCCGYSDL